MKHFIVTVYTVDGRYRGNGIARTWSELGQAAAEHFGADALRIIVRPAHG